MKKIFIFFFLFININLLAETYVASTLHNAVSRSETVLGIFTDRWEMLQKKNFFTDFYGKINWTPDFNVKTYNRGSGKYEPVSLNLVRTYGSMTFALPLTDFRSTENDSDLILAFSTAGFHYGLTRTVTIDRGPGEGTETVSDYKHPQFFDDIFAVSLLFRPYLNVHTGLILNQEYIPEDNGTMDYWNPESSAIKYFISSNLLEALGMELNADKDSINKMEFSLDLTKTYSLLSGTKISHLHPVIKLVYQYINAYNDEPWDSVWVGTTYNKTQVMNDSLKEKAVLNVVTAKLNQRLSNFFTTETQISFQHVDKTIYEKNTLKEIDVNPLKEFHFIFACEPIITGINFNFKLYTGLSWYWNPAVEIHRERGSGYDLWGWSMGLDIGTSYMGLESRVVYNYSEDVDKLIETADKWSFEGCFFFRL